MPNNAAYWSVVASDCAFAYDNLIVEPFDVETAYSDSTFAVENIDADRDTVESSWKSKAGHNETDAGYKIHRASADTENDLYKSIKIQKPGTSVES